MLSLTVRNRWVMAVLAVAWVVVLVVSSQREVLAGPADTRADLPLDRGVNQRVADFTLEDVASNRPISLYSFIGKKAIVLVFLGTDCPVGNLYVPRLNELNNEFRSRASCSSASTPMPTRPSRTSPSTCRDAGIEFPVLKDPGNLVADAALVERTCELIVLDGFARIRYRGAIDDQYVQGKGKDSPRPDLPARRPASGRCRQADRGAGHARSPAACSTGSTSSRSSGDSRRGSGPLPEVSRVEARDEEHPIEVGKVTYAGEVAAIIQNQCQTCHRPGQVGPFSLLTYDDARKHTAMIREVVDRPPDAPLARRSALRPFRSTIAA